MQELSASLRRKSALSLALIVACSASLGGCSSSAPFSLQAVEPAEGDTARSLSISIRGSNFVSAVRANFDDGDRSSISAHYSATLGGVELTDVQRVSPQLLRATIPAGALAAGSHALSVSDAAGRQASLGAAFTALGHAPDADAGLPADGDAASGDGTSDGTSPDTTSPDSTSDTVLPPDTGGPIGPVSQAGLGATLGAARVPCVDRNGKSSGSTTPVVDDNEVRFFDWATVMLPTAPSSTRSWVGNRPAVAVRFNPNACDGENVFGGNEGWVSACIIVRGARLDTQARLVIEPTVTLVDMDLVNCRSSGTMQSGGEFARPDDSELATRYPQLVNPIGAVKQAILDMAHN